MAKWKMAGHMAVAIKEAEKQAEQKRIIAEQYEESKRNGNILRKLARHRARINCSAKVPFIKDEKMMKVLNEKMDEYGKDVFVAGSDYFKRQDELHREVLMENVQCKDIADSDAQKVRDAIQLLKVKERAIDKETHEVKMKLRPPVWRPLQPDKVLKRQEVAQHSYGRQLNANRMLREQITHLELERDKVAVILQNLESDCEALSKELHANTEVAKTTYESRDMARANMNKIKDAHEKNEAAFDGEMQLMQFRIDVLRRMERFMTTKNKFRPDEGRTRRQENRSQPSMTEKDSMHYRSLLDRISSDLKEENVNFIISAFVELESENYMLFKNISETREYCHGMNTEIEEVKSQINSIRKARQQAEQEAFAHKMELMEKTELCKKESEKREEFIRKADQVIQIYIKSILAMLNKLGYTEERITELAGVFSGIEERNISDFLAELEHYINKIYDLKILSDFLAYDRARRHGDMPPPPEPMPPRQAVVQRVVVMPPQFEEEEDADESGLPTEAAFRPLTLSEISRHVEENLEERERREEMGTHIPSPTMTDATSTAIGDMPLSPVVPHTSVENY